MKLSIIKTRTVPTIKVEQLEKTIILHSKYDPLNEAKKWAENETKRLKVNEKIIVIGLSAGYHVQQLAKFIPHKPITVIEFNDTFFNWFKQSELYKNVSILSNVSIKQFSNLSSEERESIFSSVRSSNLLIHKNGIDIMPSKYKGIKSILEDIKLQNDSIKNQLINMSSNFTKNLSLDDDGIGGLENIYKGKPMILISAGPSLDKQLPLLKVIQSESKFILGAVGTALKPLVNYDIVPDFFTFIDPNPGTYDQLTNLDLLITPLYYMSTAFHDTIQLHTGPRRIVWQKGFEDAEIMAKINNDPTIQSGGSVATALLDIMVYFGGEMIALVGQDLAYTDGRSHATATHLQREFKDFQIGEKVTDYYQTGKVYTANNFNLYRRWFEHYAKEHPHLKLYNCTEGGAYIQNWEHISLKDYYLKYI